MRQFKVLFLLLVVFCSSATLASETSVVITALDKLAMTADGKTTDLFGRVTFVVARSDADWRIVGFHRSAMPS